MSKSFVIANEDGFDIVLGLFCQDEDADRSITELVAAGIPEERLMVLTKAQILDETSQAGREAIDSGELQEIATEHANEMLGAMLTLILSREQAIQYTVGMRQGNILVVARSLEGQGMVAQQIMINSNAVRVTQIHQEAENILLASENRF